MKINLEELRKRSEFINCKRHDSLNLFIWNYNQVCQYNKKWDKYTKLARGLITDFSGNIIARSFPKFFNINETEETKTENLPNEIPMITEKIDGSLGILYFENSNACIATRGSFNSDQAKWATDWIQKRFIKSDFKDGYTYLWEIIYPENRIVIDYGDMKELILIAVINIENGSELKIEIEAKRLKVNHVNIINKDIKRTMLELDNIEKREGFVARYSNGFRVKMKCKEYVRLHKIISSFSSISIWECLMNNDNFNEILIDVPDEFYKWVKIKKAQLENDFTKIEKRAKECFNKVKDINNRKEQAIYIMKNHKDISNIVFPMLDGKAIEKIIWKKIRPEYEMPKNPVLERES